MIPHENHNGREKKNERLKRKRSTRGFPAIVRGAARTTVPSRRREHARRGGAPPCRSRTGVNPPLRVGGGGTGLGWRISPAARLTAADGSRDARRRGAAARQDVSSPSHRATVGSGFHERARQAHTLFYTRTPPPPHAHAHTTHTHTHTHTPTGTRTLHTRTHVARARARAIRIHVHACTRAQRYRDAARVHGPAARVHASTRAQTPARSLPQSRQTRTRTRTRARARTRTRAHTHVHTGARPQSRARARARTRVRTHTVPRAGARTTAPCAGTAHVRPSVRRPREFADAAMRPHFQPRACRRRRSLNAARR
jgi:hypothetical protein